MNRRAILPILTILLALSLLLPTSNLALAADSDIIISEVMSNPFCESANGTNTGCEGGSIEIQYEWVEIYNRGSTATDIASWQICDSLGCDTITSSSTLIGPGEYWLIGSNSAALQTEIGPSGANYGIYDGSRTIILPGSIGSNGLANAGDTVYLRTSSGGPTTDCISWASPAALTCASQTYVPGGTGFDSTLISTSELDGHSITNVQGTWYYHNTAGNGAASPYAANTASGGSPTAVVLHKVAARSTDSLSVVVITIVCLFAAALFATLQRRSRAA